MDIHVTAAKLKILLEGVEMLETFAIDTIMDESGLYPGPARMHKKHMLRMTQDELHACRGNIRDNVTQLTELTELRCHLEWSMKIGEAVEADSFTDG